MVEIQAPEGYQLGEKEEDNTYEIEITSRFVDTEVLTKEYENYYQGNFGGMEQKNLALGENSIIKTKDGGYVIVLYDAEGMIIKKGQITNFEQDYELTGRVSSIKYNAEGKIENIIEDEIFIGEVQDGFYTLGETIKKYKNNEVVLEFENKYDFYDILINEQGELIFVSEGHEDIIFDETETANGEKIEKINNGGSDIALTKFNNNGKVEWVTSFGSKSYDDTHFIKIINNEIFMIAEFGGETTISDIDTAEGKGEISVVEGEYLIKYNQNGKVEDIRNIEQPYLSVHNTILAEDGMIETVVVEENQTISGLVTVDGNEIELEASGYPNTIIKYSYDGKVEWAKQFKFPCVVTSIDERTNVIAIINMEEVNIPGEYTADGEDILIDGINKGISIFELDEDFKIKFKLLEMNLDQYEYAKQPLLAKDINNDYIIGNFTYDTFILEKYKRESVRKEVIPVKELTITNEIEDSFRLVKQNTEKTKLLPGAKFTIKEIVENEDGTINKIDAVDRNGNIIGNLENINGQELRVVTTDENGEIREKLKQGKYEVQEVQAPNGYKFAEENNIHQFEITVKQQEERDIVESFSMFLSDKNVGPAPEKLISKIRNLYEIKAYKLTNGEVILSVDAEDVTRIDAKYTVNNQDIELIGEYIIKFNKENKIEWAIERDYSSSNIILFSDDSFILYGNYGKIIKYNKDGVVETKGERQNYPKIKRLEDGSIIYFVKLDSEYTISADKTMNSKELKLQARPYMIKYNKNGKIEWVIDIISDNCKDMQNNSYMMYGTAHNSAIIPKEHNIENSDIIIEEGKKYIANYNLGGKVWVVQNYLNREPQDFEDGNFMVYGTASTSVVIPKEKTVNNVDVTLEEGKNYIIKYTENGKIEYVINNYIEGGLYNLSDGSFLLYSKKDTENTITIPAVETVDNKEITLDSGNPYIIKLDKNKKVEWASICLPSARNVNAIITKDNSVMITLDCTFKSVFTIPAKYMQSNNSGTLYFDGTFPHMIKYNNQGKIEKIEHSYINVKNFVQVEDEGYIFIGSTNTINFVIPKQLTVDKKEIPIEPQRTTIMKYTKDFLIKEVFYNEYISNNYPINLEVTENDGLIIEGKSRYLWGTVTISSEDTASGETISLQVYSDRILRLTYNNDNKIVDAKSIMSSDSNNDVYYDDINENPIGDTEDGGHITGAWSDDIGVIPAEQTVRNREIKLKSGEFALIKLNQDKKVEWAITINPDKDKLLDASDGNSVLLLREEDNKFYLKRYELQIVKDKVLNPYEMKVTNEKIEHQIITEVKGEGGTISGWENKGEPYEIVGQGGDAKKEVKISPKRGYKVAKVYINGEEIEFKENEDGTVSLEQLTNVTEDKHIEVEFERKELKITVQYLEKETGKKLLEDEEIKGYIEEEYEAEEKEIEYYKIDKETYPQNTKGVIEEDATIKYYYTKKDFNFKVEKWIDSVEVNGQAQKLNNTNNDKSKNITKIEINRKEIDRVKIKINYKIKITNTGEIAGKVGKVIDYMPDGIEITEDSSKGWNKNNNTLTQELENIEILPGESKEIDIVANWKNGEDNFGTKTNRVEIVGITNKANFEETETQDNKSQTDMIISIQTGMQKTIIFGLTIISLITLTATCIFIIIKRKNNNIR